MSKRKKFYIEYWDADDNGTYVENASFYADNIINASKYSENKYGSVILVKEVGIFFGDEG